MHLIFWYTVSSTGGSSLQLSASFGTSQTNCLAMSKATLTLTCHLPWAFQHPAQQHARVRTAVWTGHFEPSLSSHKQRFTAVSSSGRAAGRCSSAACPTHHRKASSRATRAGLLSLVSSWEQQRTPLLPLPIIAVTVCLRGTCEGPEPGHTIWRAKHLWGTPLAPCPRGATLPHTGCGQEATSGPWSSLLA